MMIRRCFYSTIADIDARQVLQASGGVLQATPICADAGHRSPDGVEDAGRFLNDDLVF